MMNAACQRVALMEALGSARADRLTPLPRGPGGAMNSLRLLLKVREQAWGKHFNTP